MRRGAMDPDTYRMLVDPTTARADAPGDGGIPSSDAKVRVLLVDDNAGFRESLIALLDAYGLRVAAVHRVEAEEVREIVGFDEVVHADQLESGIVDHELQDRAPDASKSVDGNSRRHARR